MDKAPSFVPMGQYDECSVFIDGVFARKRKLDEGGDYDLVNDDTDQVVRAVSDSLRFMDSKSSVTINVIHDDKEAVVTLHKSQAPYPKRAARIENMCGILGEPVHKGLLRGACIFASTVFGMNHELYHTEGNVTVVRGKAFFKGCRFCFIQNHFIFWLV